MLIIGHRGARGLAPENTIASFEAALQNGVDGVELDVRTSKDHIAVLHHNETIGKQPIHALTYDELCVHKPDLLSLATALEFLEGKTKVTVELKPGCELGPVLACFDKTIASVSVASFDFALLQEAKKVLPDTPIIVNEGWSGVRAGRRARKLGTKYITMNQRWLWGGFIRALTKRGYKLSAYTVNNPKQAARFAKHGLYAVITDYPDRFKS